MTSAAEKAPQPDVHQLSKALEAQIAHLKPMHYSAIAKAIDSLKEAEKDPLYDHDDPDVFWPVRCRAWTHAMDIKVLAMQMNGYARSRDARAVRTSLRRVLEFLDEYTECLDDPEIYFHIDEVQDECRSMVARLLRDYPGFSRQTGIPVPDGLEFDKSKRMDIKDPFLALTAGLFSYWPWIEHEPGNSNVCAMYL